MQQSRPSPISPEQIEGVLQFLKESEKLKDVMRSAHTSQGNRESTAEHSWRLCLSVLALGPWLAHLDVNKLLKLCVVHDLGEALNGDTPATQQHADPDKSQREAHDMRAITATLPSPVREEIMSLWDEYEHVRSAEARIAKGLDKIETILQHVQGKNPADFDYAFNLDYGKKYTDTDPLLAQLRARIDLDTQRCLDEGCKGGGCADGDA